MIGTGEEKVFSLDMSNEVAADQGMVCGGRMLVYVVVYLNFHVCKY